MDPIMAALLALAPDLDDELREGFQRYAAALDSILTPAQRQTYAALIRRVGAVQVFEDLAPDAMAALTPDEAAIATALLADEAPRWKTAASPRCSASATSRARRRSTIEPRRRAERGRGEVQIYARKGGGGWKGAPAPFRRYTLWSRPKPSAGADRVGDALHDGCLERAKPRSIDRVDRDVMTHGREVPVHQRGALL